MLLLLLLCVDGETSLFQLTFGRTIKCFIEKVFPIFRRIKINVNRVKTSKMGYELTRFQGDVDEELVCPICAGVLEEPLQAAVCEHAFCRACITEWLSRQPTCPVDRSSITTTNLRPVPRILKNLLSRLSISCDNAIYGCTQILKLDSLNNHLDECEHNPKKPLPCERGCGSIIPKDEFKVRPISNQSFFIFNWWFSLIFFIFLWLFACIGSQLYSRATRCHSFTATENSRYEEWN